MGFVWDLIQHAQIEDRRAETETLEGRVRRLEDRIAELEGLLITLLERLEERFGEDIDRDGRVGGQPSPGP